MEVITRKEAQERGLKRYYTGENCKKGHLCERYISSFGCVQCQSEIYGVNKEDRSAWSKAYYQLHRELKLEQANSYYRLNREIISIRRKAHYKTDPEKYCERERMRYAKDSSLSKLKAANRHAKKLKASPKWVDIKKLKEFYVNIPDTMEVDHIIPLQGKLVSGLHVHNNLQYLSREENRSKTNKFIPHLEIKGVRIEIEKKYYEYYSSQQ